MASAALGTTFVASTFTLAVVFVLLGCLLLAGMVAVWWLLKDFTLF